MPAVILRERWRYQPVGSIEPDFSHPLAVGLRFCWTPAEWLFWERYGNKAGSATGTVSPGSGVGGAYATFNDGVHSNVGWGTYPALAGGAVTVLALAQWGTSKQQVAISQRYADGGNFPQLAFAANTDLNFGSSAGSIALLGYNGGYHSLDTSSAIDGKLSAYMAMMPASGMVGAGFYINGVPKALTNSAQVTSTWGDANQKLTVGNFADNTGTGYAATDPLYLVLAWDGMLADGLAREISVNPWQIFKARVQRLYFGVAAAGGATDLVVDDITHAHPADGALALTQVHALTLADLAHGHPVDGSLSLSQVHVLTVADVAHSHPVDGTLSLTQTHVVTLADLLHAHPVDGDLSLSGAASLVVQDATHGHPVDGNLGLTQVHVLIVSDSLHAQLVDGGLGLAQVHVLVVDDATHAHPIDGGLVLTGGSTLQVQDLTHGHPVDGALALGQVHIITVADALHAHVVDPVLLTQTHVLIVSSSTHAHMLDALTLSTLTAITPGTRLILVPQELRHVLVPQELRHVIPYH